MSVPAEKKQTFLLILMMGRKIFKYEKRHSSTCCLLWKEVEIFEDNKICLVLLRKLMSNTKLVQLLHHNGATAVIAVHSLDLLEIYVV